MTATSAETICSAGYAHDELVGAIDARISEIDSQLSALESLRGERDRLVRARRALVGSASGAPEARLSAAAVLAMLADHPGVMTGELAALLGHGDASVRAHLHRARQAGHCVARSRRWYVTERVVAGVGEGLDGSLASAAAGSLVIGSPDRNEGPAT